MAENRNAEIWSTRLQKELLALTTDNASQKETEEVAGSLPPFVKVKGHELVIESGICKITFSVNVEKPSGGTTDIEVSLDVSLLRKADGSVDGGAPAYPFLKPKAIVVSGAGDFPEGSTIKDGDKVDIDCDWTPSLHITDAVANVGLKMKESILQNEPFFPAEEKNVGEDLMKGAKRFSEFLKNAGAQIGNTGKSLRKKKTRKSSTPDKVSIGDEINLVEAPWVDCKGLYSCKAIRRPAFVTDAINLAEAKRAKDLGAAPSSEEVDVPDDFGNYVKLQAGNIGKVAGAGIAGAGAMLRSFTASAKSVLEESFLMITETHIIEIRSSKLNLSVGTVTFAIAIDNLSKLKFRRQESISLFFKPAPDDPFILMCPDSADAVHQIQNVLKQKGVKGKHTNAATQRAIHEALQIVQEIQAKERALEYKPSVERVNEIMDLYRQAAERFEVAGDVRHEEVMIHMKKFLAMPITAGILDGSYKPPSTPDKPENPYDVPEGEVLATTLAQLEDDDMSMNSMNSMNSRASLRRRMKTPTNKGDDAEFNENIDKLLQEANQEFDKMNIGRETESSEEVNYAIGDEALADLDAMLQNADKELADIMAS